MTQSNELNRLSQAMADAVDAASAQVVSVAAGRGVSGTVVGPELVLTVAHVLPGDEVHVTAPDGRTLPGTLAGRDPVTDLALLRVPGLAGQRPTAATPRVGELLLAVGRPQGQVQASLGLLGRGVGAPPAAPDWMDSGAAPFRGVSGGALVSAAGELVGLLNAGVARGELLAVPAARALAVADQLAERGRVPQGYLGIGTQPVHFPESEASQTEPGNESPGRGPRGPRGLGGRRGPRGRLGLTVVSVEAGSPAVGSTGAGSLQVGDVLLALDGQPLRRPHDLHEWVRARPGQTVTLRLLRGGQESDLPLTLGER